jgi:hypothetical protein
VTPIKLPSSEITRSRGWPPDRAINSRRLDGGGGSIQGPCWRFVHGVQPITRAAARAPTRWRCAIRPLYPIRRSIVEFSLRLGHRGNLPSFRAMMITQRKNYFDMVKSYITLRQLCKVLFYFDMNVFRFDMIYLSKNNLRMN